MDINVDSVRNWLRQHTYLPYVVAYILLLFVCQPLENLSDEPKTAVALLLFIGWIGALAFRFRSETKHKDDYFKRPNRCDRFTLWIIAFDLFKTDLMTCFQNILKFILKFWIVQVNNLSNLYANLLVAVILIIFCAAYLLGIGKFNTFKRIISVTQYLKSRINEKQEDSERKIEYDFSDEGQTRRNTVVRNVRNWFQNYYFILYIACYALIIAVLWIGLHVENYSTMLKTVAVILMALIWIVSVIVRYNKEKNQQEDDFKRPNRWDRFTLWIIAFPFCRLRIISVVNTILSFINVQSSDAIVYICLLGFCLLYLFVIGKLNCFRFVLDIQHSHRDRQIDKINDKKDITEEEQKNEQLKQQKKEEKRKNTDKILDNVKYTVISVLGKVFIIGLIVILTAISILFVIWIASEILSIEIVFNFLSKYKVWIITIFIIIVYVMVICYLGILQKIKEHIKDRKTFDIQNIFTFLYLTVLIGAVILLIFNNPLEWNIDSSADISTKIWTILINIISICGMLITIAITIFIVMIMFLEIAKYGMKLVKSVEQEKPDGEVNILWIVIAIVIAIYVVIGKKANLKENPLIQTLTDLGINAENKLTNFVIVMFALLITCNIIVIAVQMINKIFSRAKKEHKYQLDNLADGIINFTIGLFASALDYLYITTLGFLDVVKEVSGLKQKSGKEKGFKKMLHTERISEKRTDAKAYAIKVLPPLRLKYKPQLRALIRLFSTVSLVAAFISCWTTAQGFTSFVFENLLLAGLFSVAIQGALFGISSRFFFIWKKLKSGMVRFFLIVIGLCLLVTSSSFSFVAMSKQAYNDSTLRTDAQQIVSSESRKLYMTLSSRAKEIEDNYKNKNLSDYVTSNTSNASGLTQDLVDELTKIKDTISDCASALNKDASQFFTTTWADKIQDRLNGKTTYSKGEMQKEIEDDMNIIENYRNGHKGQITSNEMTATKNYRTALRRLRAILNKIENDTTQTLTSIISGSGDYRNRANELNDEIKKIQGTSSKQNLQEFYDILDIEATIQEDMGDLDKNTDDEKKETLQTIRTCVENLSDYGLDAATADDCLGKIDELLRLYYTELNDFDRAFSLLTSSIHTQKLMLIMSIVLAFMLDLTSFFMGFINSCLEDNDEENNSKIKLKWWQWVLFFAAIATIIYSVIVLLHYTAWIKYMFIVIPVVVIMYMLCQIGINKEQAKSKKEGSK